MDTSRFAAILSVYGKPSDRFMTAGYRDANRNVIELIDIAGKQGLIKAVEIAGNTESGLNDRNKKEILAALEKYDLKICAVDPNLFGELRWSKGSIGAADAKTRRAAVDLVKSTMDLAASVGCDYIGIWPGQDGYDYLLEVDYQKMYDAWVEGIQECADHNRQVKIGLEFKPFEPRTHSFLNTNDRTLLLLHDIQRDNVGVTYDVGHSLYAHDNLAEVVAMAQRWNKLFHVHLNDNYGDWDWDMNMGSVHLFDFVEMLYWLKKTNYQGWYSVDIFPYRTDGAESVSESLNWLGHYMDLVDQVGQQKFDELVACGDPILVSKFFRELLFGKK